ncbi:uncharacterized protein L201_004553 [Kwoniella dendrophila CBS 6074]|uniref:RNA helicase n=1 Tax=Kwoniella dendrophila CBS 6074 TaxID=1295534 RepID=A0AAX4JXN4_9TREE
MVYPHDGSYIHPSWHDIVPLIYSSTHPNHLHPYLESINLHPQIHSLSNPTSSPVPPSTPGSIDTFNSDFPPLGQYNSSAQPSSPLIYQTGRARTNGQGKQNLDRFASKYTPQWLKQLPTPSYTFHLDPVAAFPPPHYAAEVFTPKLLSNPLPIAQQCPSLLALPPAQGSAVPFQSSTALSNLDYYAKHFSNLLSLHLSALLENTRQAFLPLTSIQPYPVAGLSNTYRIYVPGIREDSPRLYIGDRMIIRGLYQQYQQASINAIEAEVVGLEKTKSWVYVQSPHLGRLDGDRVASANGAGVVGNGFGVRCQIKFLLNVKPVCDMQDAVRTFGLLQSVKFEIVHRWLFPEVQHVKAESRNTSQRPIEWVDEGLNEEQKGAVSAIVSGSHRIPYLISGPPGVSKTKTIVEIAQQIIISYPESSILICAPSNSAADTLARRLCKASHPSADPASDTTIRPGIMLRLNNPSRTFAEVPGEILPFCYVATSPDGIETFSIPSFTDLMKYRVIISSCQDAGILVTANATNTAMMKAESELIETFHPISKISRTKEVLPHWTHLLIDEAAQASEPETLIPLSVVVPYPLPKGYNTVDPTVVLCGDSQQLGPIVSSSEARDGELDVSLLERLFDREIYATHSNSRRSQQLRNRHLQSDWEAPFTNLVQNYRSIAPILMIPAAMFYEDTLIPSARDVKLLEWKDLPNAKLPILFQGCEGEENWIDESWYNPSEINAVIRIISSLLESDLGVEQKEIAVITPWREQVWKMRARLRSSGYHEVDVGNVETYQGAEFRVTIVSCVRSRERFLDDDRKNNMGLFNERKRFNVAITRAKEILVVVGNANLLKRDPYWNGFLQIMLRNNLYIGPELDLEVTGAYMSRLESTIHDNETHDPEEATMRLAGALARETLRDD